MRQAERSRSERAESCLVPGQVAKANCAIQPIKADPQLDYIGASYLCSLRVLCPRSGIPQI